MLINVLFPKTIFEASFSFSTLTEHIYTQTQHKHKEIFLRDFFFFLITFFSAFYMLTRFKNIATFSAFGIFSSFVAV
jgi:hypothetical protein